MHVLANCHHTMPLRKTRHEAIVQRLARALKPDWSIFKRDQRVDASGLRPDLIITNGRKALIVDVAVVFDNGPQAFQRAREHKIQKYQGIANSLRPTFPEISVDAFIVGALGFWDKSNEALLRKISFPGNRNRFLKLCISDAIRHTKQVFHKHMFGTLPPSDDVSESASHLESNPRVLREILNINDNSSNLISAAHNSTRSLPRKS